MYCLVKGSHICVTVSVIWRSIGISLSRLNRLHGYLQVTSISNRTFVQVRLTEFLSPEKSTLWSVLFLYIKYKEMQHYRTDIANQAKRSKTTVIKTDTWFSKRYRKCIEAIICDDSLCMYYNLVSMHIFTTSYVSSTSLSLYANRLAPNSN